MRAPQALDRLSMAFAAPALAPPRRLFVAGAPFRRPAASAGTRPLRMQPRATAADVLVAAQSDTAHEADPAAAFDSVVMHTYARYPVAMSHGRGARLYTVDGTEFLDFVAGIATCTLGHADERIVEAVSTQVRKLGHVSNLYYIPEQARLAKWLVDHSPADKVFFCNSGAEANEAAIKLVRKFWHQKKAAAAPAGAIPVILTAVDSFHGRTLATITATGQPKYQADFGPLVAGFEYVPYNDVEALEAAAARLGPSLAGVMLEALQGIWCASRGR
jgi:acetylornithine/N-succinyldiaminopimelate aminotransferase